MDFVRIDMIKSLLKMGMNDTMTVDRGLLFSLNSQVIFKCELNSSKLFFLLTLFDWRQEEYEDKDKIVVVVNLLTFQ